MEYIVLYFLNRRFGRMLAAQRLDQQLDHLCASPDDFISSIKYQQIHVVCLLNFTKIHGTGERYRRIVLYTCIALWDDVMPQHEELGGAWGLNYYHICRLNECILSNMCAFHIERQYTERIKVNPNKSTRHRHTYKEYIVRCFCILLRKYLTTNWRVRSIRNTSRKKHTNYTRAMRAFFRT